MLAISEQDIINSVTCNELVDAMETAFRIHDSGSFLMPNRMHLQAGESTLLLMPCFAGDHFSTKLVSVFPANAEKKLPTLQGVMILNNGKTGEPLALLNGPKLTAMRTAAVGGLGVRILAPGSTEKLGIIGAGVQGFHQALFACSQRPIREIRVLSRTLTATERFISCIAPLLPDITLRQARTPEELVAESQVIITASSSSSPVLPDDIDLLRGKCIIGIGSFKPEMMEFSPALYKNLDQLFVDTEFAISECGDLAIPLKEGWIGKNRIYPFADLITGKRKTSDSPTTCFKSVGMALFDLAAAELIFRKAQGKNLGTEINL